jgi:hypothetical protein
LGIVELYRGGQSAILSDFKEATVFNGKSVKRKKLTFQDKGQAQMVAAFLAAAKNGASSPIAFAELAAVTRATLGAVESLMAGAVLSVSVV